MSRSRRGAGTGGGSGGAVRGPASALTSFLAGLGVEPSARLTTWGDNTLIRNGADSDALAHDGPILPGADLDHAGAVTARTVEAGLSTVQDALPSKRKRPTSVNSDDLDVLPDETPARPNVAPCPLRPVGSFMDCGECGKRFTVTAYTKEHPKTSNIWLCLECCFDLGIDPYAKPKKLAKKKPAAKEDRAKVVHYEQRKGTTALSDICIGLVGKHIEHVDELGDIGSINFDKVCKIISKSRKLTPETAALFYSGDRAELAMYDCTNLAHDSYVTMSVLCPSLQRLHLHLCGQLQTDSLIAWGQNLHHLCRLELFGPFLVRKEGWIRFFNAVGDRLQGLLVTQSPRIDPETIDHLVTACPKVTELRLAEVEKLDASCLGSLGNLPHLSLLDLSSPGSSLADDAVAQLLARIGGNLTDLDLSDNPDLTDAVLVAIAKHCPKLLRLRLRNLVELSDDGVTGFFRVLQEQQRPGLEMIDLQKGHVLSGKALSALIQHSGNTLTSLSILGWRDVESEAVSKLAVCQQLVDVNLGWCRRLTDFAVKDLLDGCGCIETIRVWGCNQLTDAIPRRRGVKVIGIESHTV